MTENTTKSGKTRQLLKKAAAFGGSATGTGAAHAEAAAADALGVGLKHLLDTATQYSGMGADQLKGFLFERIEVAKLRELYT